jgi:uracil-DNA glycosylase family 4
MSDRAAAEPPRDCGRCLRLAAFRERQQALHPDWFNAPVPSFGDLDPRLVIVGLAPGLNGANRTGRPFTGDYAGVLLYETLARFGLAVGRYEARADDGLALRGARIVNAVRCVPPENKPLPQEIERCRPFLAAELDAAGRLAAILALGQIAHRQAVAALGLRQSLYPFAHGALHRLPGGVVLGDSYHCSRYNTNTGRLTAAMFESALGGLLEAASFLAAERRTVAKPGESDSTLR